MTSISDNFNRANGGLGANWTDIVGAPVISSNRFIQNGTDVFNPGAAKHNTPLSTNDLEISAVSNIANAHAVVLYARMLSGGDVDQGYGAELRQNAGGLLVSLLRLPNDAGIYVVTEQQSTIGATGGVDHALRMVIKGSRIYIWLDTVLQIVETNTTYASGTYGLVLSEYNDSGLDDFALADYSGAVPATPDVRSHTFEAGTSLGSANAQPLPSGAASGDLVLYFIANDAPGATDISVSTGWTLLNAQVQGSNVIKGNIAARVLDGTTGNNICSVTGAAQDYSIAAVRVASGNHGVSNVATDIPNGGTTGSSGNADPPSLDPGSAKDWLWLACGIVDTTTASTLTAAPVKYNLIENNKSNASTTSCLLAVATRPVEASQTENPGAFTNSTRGWIAYSVAIPPLSTTVALVVADLTAASVLDNVALTQHHVLTVADLTAASVLDAVALTQHNVLAVADLTVASTLDAVVLTQHNVLAVADLTGASDLDAVALTQHNVLAVADLTGASALDNVDLTQHNVLAVDDMTAASTIENVTLGVGTTTLVVADLTVASTLDDTVLTQHHVLVVADLTGASVLDAVALTQHNVLALDDLTVASTIDNVILATIGTLAVDELTVASLLDAVALTQHNVLVVADLAVASTVEAPALGVGLGVADLSAAITLAAVILVQHHILVVANLTVAVDLASPITALPPLTPPFRAVIVAYSTSTSITATTSTASTTPVGVT